MALRALHKVVVSDFDILGVVALKTTNESVTSSTTLQNDDQLVVPVAANTKYMIEGFIIYDGLSAAGLKVAVTAPAGATTSFAAFGPQSGGPGINSYNANVVAAGGALGLECNGVGTLIGAEPKGYVATAGTSGSLQFQFAQVVSNATAVRVFANSWLKVTKVV
jgi:hypothetical protein